MPIMDNMGTANVQVERDHSPLPDVEAGLFVDDFSFGGSSASVPASGSHSPNGGGGVEGEALSAAGVDPKGAVWIQVLTLLRVLRRLPRILYSDSGSPDMAHFEQQHHQPQHHHHHDH